MWIDQILTLYLILYLCHCEFGIINFFSPTFVYFKNRIKRFVRYSRRTSNYPERITLSTPTHMISMADSVAIGVKTLRIDSGCFLEKEFTKLIRMNPWIIVYLNVNQVDSYHGCVCYLLTWDTKDILWIDDRVLIMTYESPATGYRKCYILDRTWSSRRWLCDQDEIISPQYLRRLTQWMRCNEILGQGSGNIR